MRQLKAEYYKMKYSRASKWVLVFMAFIFFIPFVVGNDTLFMTFGDYRNIDSIGWICYIDDMNNVKAAEIARFALSINFFSWIGLIVYITTMVSAEFHQGTIRASVVYGINRTKLFLSKLLVINVHFFILYYIVETALGLGLAWKYGFHYKGEEFLIFIGMVTLNMIAMIGMEAVAVLITVLVKNTGIVAALSCVYFFAGAITYPNFNAVICAVLLLLLIWAMDYLFSLCFKKSDLGISEKKRYIFMAYVGACISGFIIASRDASKLALEIPNITISVLIGAYVPFTLLLEDGKKGKVELQSMKEEWEEKYKKTFRERKAKDILSVLLFAMVYGVLLGVALSPAQNIINDIASGIGMGMATVVVAFVGLVEVKNRLTKRKNKREDADQEKSGTE